ncbi:MAG: exodeoxyribonuclease VII small subunit [Saprospiraceae bacterium]|nr:exodeoxyribonuclease VII small subunit [Saprospiraceae bacterium]
MKKKQVEKPDNYESAWAELQQVVNELQSGAVGIDELSAKIERASELVRFCRERLRNTEDAVSRLGNN